MSIFLPLKTRVLRNYFHKSFFGAIFLSFAFFTGNLALAQQTSETDSNRNQALELIDQETILKLIREDEKFRAELKAIIESSSSDRERGKAFMENAYIQTKLTEAGIDLKKVADEMAKRNGSNTSSNDSSNPLNDESVDSTSTNVDKVDSETEYELPASSDDEDVENSEDEVQIVTAEEETEDYQSLASNANVDSKETNKNFAEKNDVTSNKNGAITFSHKSTYDTSGKLIAFEGEVNGEKYNDMQSYTQAILQASVQMDSPFTYSLWGTTDFTETLSNELDVVMEDYTKKATEENTDLLNSYTQANEENTDGAETESSELPTAESLGLTTDTNTDEEESLSEDELDEEVVKEAELVPAPSASSSETLLERDPNSGN